MTDPLIAKALEMEGDTFVNAVTPLLRASDIRGLADPFAWFLARRLGLSHALSNSKALSRGSWFHAVFRCWKGRHTPQETLSRVETLLSLRLAELSETCDRLGLDGDRRRAILEREEKDALTAHTWFEASRTVPICEGPRGTRIPWTEWLTLPHFQWVDIEPTLVFVNEAAQPDLLLFHRTQRTLWIVDFKTCTGSPLERLDTCRAEFQTHHYMGVLSACLVNGVAQRHWSLPKDVRLGGFIHIAVSKPSIEFCDLDRDFTVDTTPFKTGPRKGQPRNERVYQGEPKLSNYRERVREWFTSTERYAHLAPERETDPPVNVSIVSASVLADPHLGRTITESRRLHINGLIRRPPTLEHYPAVGDVELPMMRSPLFPLRRIDPSQWAQWLSAGGFTVHHRNDPALVGQTAIIPFEDPLP